MAVWGLTNLIFCRVVLGALLTMCRGGFVRENIGSGNNTFFVEVINTPKGLTCLVCVGVTNVVAAPFG